MLLIKAAAEFVGSFVLFGVILTTGEAIPIALALVSAIFLVGKISGANLNPAVSLMLFLKGELSGASLASYAVAQLLAAVAAFGVFSSLKQRRFFIK